MESRYPKEAILAGQTGCSSLEYVINPAGRAEQIRVLDSSDPQFSDAAIAVLQQWQWQATPPTRSTSRSNPYPLRILHRAQRPALRHQRTGTALPGEDVVRSTGLIYTQV